MPGRISYEQARETVREAFQATWQEGTFCLDDRLIVEDDELYVFSVGPRELLVDGDVSFARFGGGVPGIVKATGQLVVLPEVRLALRHGGLRIATNPVPTV